MPTSPLPVILVAEDNPSLRRLIVRMLTNHGYAALEAASGAQGLALFRANRKSIALAILDMVMPGMSGLDLAAELDRERPGMKILYISGYLSSIAMDVISRRAPEMVLPKPFTEKLLIERVEHLLGGHRRGASAATQPETPC